ncbi:hypothetical protein L3X38_006462 [Prunus dulcis]|uniref:Uncharacterized protein n=1 Tax=Prunus dulcis TaxID=3755 RepID=A0AAD5F571_PRUDU|nr:hypothetical protein L3X38_006462 [Prunus dulcis]
MLALGSKFWMWNWVNIAARVSFRMFIPWKDKLRESSKVSHFKEFKPGAELCNSVLILQEKYLIQRPQSAFPNIVIIRLTIMASERLLILQPHNWASRRDHDMMLYYNRPGTSICMAFASEEKAEVLEPFLEKLHLLRLEPSWKPLHHSSKFEVS